MTRLVPVEMRKTLPKVGHCSNLCFHDELQYDQGKVRNVVHLLDAAYLPLHHRPAESNEIGIPGPYQEPTSGLFRLHKALDPQQT